MLTAVAAPPMLRVVATVLNRFPVTAVVEGVPPLTARLPHIVPAPFTTKVPEIEALPLLSKVDPPLGLANPPPIFAASTARVAIFPLIAVACGKEMVELLI